MTPTLESLATELLRQQSERLQVSINEGGKSAVVSGSVDLVALAGVVAWREPAAKWLEREADRNTNSLHCGDNAIAIQGAHNYASELKRAAQAIRAGAKP